MTSQTLLYAQSVFMAREITRQLISREKQRGDLWDDHSQKMLRIGKKAWERCERRKQEAHNECKQ